VNGRVIAPILVAVAIGVAACSSTPATTTTTRPTTTTTIPLPGPEGLIGSWERTGGNFSVLQGMVVEVDEGLVEGVIVATPRNPYRFEAGDVKWSDITEVSAGRLRIRDLVREADTGRSSFVTGVITIAEDRRTLDIRFPSTGTLQVWTRIP
jgi:hypothetical protein